MRIEYIKLQNWKGLSGTFKFGHLNYLTGPNGSGKSGIIQALQWALTGNIPGVGRSTDAISALMSGVDSSVEVGLFHDGEMSFILRELHKIDDSVRSSVTFKGKKTLKGTRAKAWIDLTVNPITWMLDQRSLANMGPKDRREALMELLHLPGELDTLTAEESQLVIDSKDYRSLVRRLRAVVDEGTGDLMPETIMQSEIELWTGKRDEARDALRILTNDAESAARRRSTLEANIKRVEDRKLEITARLETLASKFDPARLDELNKLGPAPEVPRKPSPNKYAFNREKALNTKRDIESMLKGAFTCPVDGEKCPRTWDRDKHWDMQLTAIDKDVARLDKLIEEYNQKILEHENAVEARNQWLAAARERDNLRSIQEQISTLTTEYDRADEDLDAYKSELAGMPDASVEDFEIQAEGLKLAVEDAQRLLDNLTAGMNRWQQVKTNQQMLAEAETGFADSTTRLKEVRRRIADLIGDSLNDLTIDATRLLNSIGIPGDVVVRPEKNSIRLGLNRDNTYVDFSVLSQGEAIMFWLALANSLLSRHEGLRLLIMEGAELDSDNTKRVLAAGESLHNIDNLMWATWVSAPVATGDAVNSGWDVIFRG